MPGSMSYAPIAAQYERVRGGAARADALAAAVEAWLPAGVICDVGAGTGVIAERWCRPDRSVVALDLSIEMLVQAAPRLPGSVMVADSGRLPLATASVDAVTFVWVLHHVEDLAATLAETRRVLRPGGRFVSISGVAMPIGDDMGSIFDALSDTLRPDRVSQAGAVAEVARSSGFSVTHEGLARLTSATSPAGLAAALEQRLFSHLWDLSAHAWTAIVVPAIEALRALPNPDLERPRVFDHPLVVADL